MIYLAFGAFISSSAMIISTNLLALHLLLIGWFYLKKWSALFIGIYLVISLSYFVNAQNKMDFSNTESFEASKFTWTSIYSINGSSLKGYAKTDSGEKWYVTYRFTSAEEKESFLKQSLVGSTFQFSGKIITVPKPPHEYAFSMETYLKSHGAVGIFEVAKWSNYSKPQGIIGLIANRRFQAEQFIDQAFPTSLAPEAKALLIGHRDDVSLEEERAYQKLGITHLFAISGLHIVFLSFIFFELLIRLHVRKQAALMILLLGLPMYGVIAGGAPSVWRAVSVSVLILLLTFTKKKISADDAFALSLLVFLFVQPGVLLQVGFQLSYAAAFCLVYSSKILIRPYSMIQKSFIITFLCQIGVFPILLYHFYEVSISSFIMNLLFVPLFSFIILPINVFLLILSATWSPLANIFFSIYEPFRTMITKIILFLSEIPYQLWNPGKPSVFLLLVAFVGVFWSFIIMEKNLQLKKMFLSLGIPILFIECSPYMNSSLDISFLNVGQGDSTVIQMPHEKGVILIDSGGLLRFEQENWKNPQSAFEIGRNVVVPFLKGKGISKIDTFIWTHADSDHIEGAEEIIEEIHITEIHLTPGIFKEAALSEALKAAKQKNIPIKEQLKGRHWSMGDTNLRYLSPNDTEYEGNNDSLVLLLEHEGFRALFTGDLEKEGEEYLLTSSKSQIENIHLLKVGHHGSKTSSSQEFIEALNPQLSIFSAGKNNRYGHPHNEVVMRFNALNLLTKTTAEEGTILIQIEDGKMVID
jgi:competence protein ComEC